MLLQQPHTYGINRKLCR